MASGRSLRIALQKGNGDDVQIFGCGPAHPVETALAVCKTSRLFTIKSRGVEGACFRSVCVCVRVIAVTVPDWQRDVIATDGK